jgi:signal transduction histidine kinase/HAMP domain-containing protein
MALSQTPPVGAPPSRKRWRAPHLSLLCREVAGITLLTFLVVATTSLFYVALLRQTMVGEILHEATLIAQQVYAQSALALTRQATDRPLRTLQADPNLRQLMDASVGHSPNLLYVMIADDVNRAVAHTDRNREGEIAPIRPSFAAFVALNPVSRALGLHQNGDTIYEVGLPMELNGRLLATIRIGIALPLVTKTLNDAMARAAALGGLAILAALALAIGLSNLTLRPIRRLAEDMERLRNGEFDVGSNAGPQDEFGKLAFQLHLLGQQIRSDRTRILSERLGFHSAVNEIEDGLMFFTATGHLVFANRAAEAVLGKPLGDVEGELLDRVFDPGHPLLDMIRQVLTNGASFRSATIELPEESAPAPFLASAFPVGAAGQDCEGAIILLKDSKAVAVSARTLQSLIQYSAQLTALGQVTSELAHEVKNPLHGMLMHVAVLKETLAAPSAEVQSSLDMLERGIAQLDAVVVRFVDLTRPKEIALSTIELNTLLRDAVAPVEAEWSGKGVAFALYLADGLPAVRGDEELLRQALTNIVLNACQAMREGGSVAMTTELETDGVVKVVVSDTGAGISAADMDQVFAMYYTTKPGGSGIGLPLVRRVVDMHNGDIQILSEVGRGTSVIVRLPVETEVS